MRLAKILILAGGGLGLVSSSISLLLVLAVFRIVNHVPRTLFNFSVMVAQYALFGYPEFGSNLMIDVMFAWSILGLAGSCWSIYYGLTRDFGLKSLFGGFLLMLAFSWLSSILVLSGGILGWIEQGRFRASKTGGASSERPM